MPSDKLILGFDTSAAHCAAALLSGDRILAAQAGEMTRGQAERLIPMLEETLAAGGATWRDLAAIGVGTGPGNFTGVRVSVAAARGLALACRIPAIGVSLFEALAEGQGPGLLVSAAAARGMVALTVAGCDGAPRLALPGDLPADLRGSGLDVVGHAAAEIAALTGGAERAVRAPLAVAVARVAGSRLGAARGGLVPRPAPVYLRPADAAPAAPTPVLLP